jgi:hypothetical protein
MYDNSVITDVGSLLFYVTSFDGFDNSPHCPSRRQTILTLKVLTLILTPLASQCTGSFFSTIVLSLLLAANQLADCRRANFLGWT